MKLMPDLFRKQPAAAPPADTPVDRVASLLAGPVDLIVATALEPGDGQLTQAARQRLAELVDAGLIECGPLLARADAQAAVFATLALCQSTERLAQVLATVSNPAQLAELAAVGASSRLRQLAAQTIHDPQQVRELLARVRGKDNTVYKILKHKRDAWNAEQRRLTEIATEAETVCTLLERHGQRAYDSSYPQIVDQLQVRWQAIATVAEAAWATRAGVALDRCHDVVVGHQQRLALEAEQHAAQRLAEAQRAQAQQAAAEAEALQAAAVAQQQREAAELQAAEAAAHAEQLAAREQLYRRIGGLIRKANEALASGTTKEAAGLRRAIDAKLPPVGDLPTHLARSLQQLDERLNALKEWKDYAVAPKRVELIAAMEALIDCGLEPKALADQIKSLQQDWRTISKGIASDASAEWEQFHKAAETAYQPCREYFEAQARQRAEHLAQRKAVLDRLLAFEAAQNGASPDWRLMGQVLREAPQQWQAQFPVDRAANRPIQEAFDAALARLQARLNSWYDRNAADKQALIARASKALEFEDGGAAIDAVKQLQLLWKNAGPVVPREQDQALWHEFRSACDAVFQKRQQAHADYVAGLEANKSVAVALCVEAEQLATQSGTVRSALATKLSELRSAMEALGELPRADARGLYARFERAMDSCKAQQARQRAQEAEQARRDLFTSARHVQDYEWSIAAGADPAQCQQLRELAEAVIAGARLWPKGALQVLQQRLARAASTAAASAASDSAAQALKTLCIRAEIMTGAATPAADADLRREFQMQKLVKGMGKGIVADTCDALVTEWLACAAVEPMLYASLEERLLQQLTAWRSD